VEQGVTALTFLLYHQADLIHAFLSTLRSEGRLGACQLHSLTEPEPLGTGGAVAYAVRQLQITGSFLVTNADTWLGCGIGPVMATEAPSIAIVRVEDSERYGSVRLGQHGRIAAFSEKRDSTGAGWINAGLYHFPASLFQDWNGQPFSLERELLPSLAKTRQLKGVPLTGEFVDIGIPADYFRFCHWIESKKVRVL
jgi:NDP-sugar pyrophosphorylase family protein